MLIITSASQFTVNVFQNNNKKVALWNFKFVFLIHKIGLIEFENDICNSE